MKKLTILSILFFLATQVISQINTNDFKVNDLVKISLNEGTEIVGEILEINESEIIIQSKTLGQITVLISDIKEMSTSQSYTILDYKAENSTNPLPYKNFLTETAIGLKKGEGYYHNVMLGGHVVAIGITDNFSIGGGFEVFSLFSGNTPLFFISPKFTFPNQSKNVHFGFGANLAFIPDSGSRTGIGTFYGLSTIGSADQNLTVGIGFAFSSGDVSDQPVFQIGGMTKVGKNFMIVTDHLIGDIESVEVFGTWTLRYINENFSLDLGAVVAYSDGAFPVGSASIKF